MKRILRSFIIEIGTFYLVSQIASGILFQNGLEGLIIAGVALTVATFLVKPIINILLLPINLLTFGVFKWISQAVTLFLVDLILPQMSIVSFDFAGLTSKWIDVPPLHLTSIILVYIAFSLLLSVISGIIYWIVK